jgi:hypothetical protein
LRKRTHHCLRQTRTYSGRNLFEDTEEVRISNHFQSHFTLRKIAISRRRFILVDYPPSLFRESNLRQLFANSGSLLDHPQAYFPYLGQGSREKVLFIASLRPVVRLFSGQTLSRRSAHLAVVCPPVTFMRKRGNSCRTRTVRAEGRESPRSPTGVVGPDSRSFSIDPERSDLFPGWSRSSKKRGPYIKRR